MLNTENEKQVSKNIQCSQDHANQHEQDEKDQEKV
jgi:hypothetical protein